MSVKQVTATFILFIAFKGSASEPNEFIEIPSKSIQFVNRITKQSIEIESYSFSYEMNYNCKSIDCKDSSGTSSGESQLLVRGSLIQTPMQKIPKMPRSGEVKLTYAILGVCRGQSSCSTSLSLGQFLKAKEPITFYFNYDPVASAIEKHNRKEARLNYLAEIEKKMGRDMSAKNQPRFSLHDEDKSFDWKKLIINVNENRKKNIPQIYSEGAVQNMGLKSLFCNSEVKQKIEKCQFASCVYPLEIMKDKSYSDFIIHGINTAGNCAISTPLGKRYFVPKADLPYFYDVFAASLSESKVSEKFSSTTQTEQIFKSTSKMAFKGASCLVTSEYKVIDHKNTIISVNFDSNTPTPCKDNKIDLLQQLELRRLAEDYSAIKIGFP